MRKKLPEEWSADSWCGATLEVGRGITGRSPGASALWLYLLWEPADRALPFREPTVVSLVNDDPWSQITDDCDGAPIYELLEDECDWSTWLDMVLQLGGMDSWTAAMLRKARKEKQEAKLAHWRNSYRSDEDTADVTTEQEFYGEGDADETREGDFGDFGLSDEGALSELDLPNEITVDEEDANPHCSCITVGAFSGGILDERALSFDVQHSCYGEVSVLICKSCKRDWLRFFFEAEAFTASGRWYLGRISPEMAGRINADLAVPYLERVSWYWRGGSFFDGIVSKGRGKLRL